MAASRCSIASLLKEEGPVYTSDHLRFSPSRVSPETVKISDSGRRSSKASCLSSKASREASVLTQGVYEQNSSHVHDGTELLEEMKDRFLTFKNQQFLKKMDKFKDLAEAQFPKFMVIACADSRVCPSKILGIQPGEAFTIRNVANLTLHSSGPSETNAALEIAVNTLEIPNIFVIGHSRCGGIRTLMSMQQEVNSSSFLENSVVTAGDARKAALVSALNLEFDHQCTHCEKESVNQSLLRLLG